MLDLSRHIRTHRPTLVFGILVSLSLLSLITGARVSFVNNGIERLVAITAYPFLKARFAAAEASDYVFTLLFTYDAMREESEQLRERIVRMKQTIYEQRELRAENDRLRGMLDFATESSRLDLRPAGVIENIEGMITVDRGRVHGVLPSMCVLASTGVVGVVVEVDDFTARVATLHHRLCKVGAMVERNRLRAYDGVIHADGTFKLICNMYYIDLQDDVRIGDRVVTSPESIFPSGYPIGTIMNVHEGESLWKWAEVEPIVDPYRLDEVFLVFDVAPSYEDRLGPPPIAVAVDTTADDPAVELSTPPAPLQEQWAP